jgi:Polyketide cyclase / dehydrase and lipid transport
MIKSVIHIESPRDFVYEVFCQYANYKLWLPNCEKSDVVGTQGNSTDIDLIVNSMKRMNMVLRFDAVPTHVLNFEQIKGSDMKAYSGSYRLMDSADGRGTVVMAELDIDAGAMAPKFLVDRMAKKAVEETGAALKQYIKTLPPPAQKAPAAQPGGAGPAKTTSRRHAKKLLEVVKTAEGCRIWYLGQPYIPGDQREKR